MSRITVALWTTGRRGTSGAKSMPAVGWQQVVPAVVNHLKESEQTTESDLKEVAWNTDTLLGEQRYSLCSAKGPLANHSGSQIR